MNFYRALLLATLLPFGIKASVLNHLDLRSNGEITPVKLAFPYFEKQENDQFAFIHQGSYGVFDINPESQQVIALGPLRPCVGIAITDGAKVLALHVHSGNSHAHMIELARQHLNIENPQNIFAHIYSTTDAVEWALNLRTIQHGGKNHIQALSALRDAITQGISAPVNQIKISFYNMLNAQKKPVYEEFALGHYEMTELNVAIRLNNPFVDINGKRELRFTSIDLAHENACMIDDQEMLNVYNAQAGSLHPLMQEMFFKQIGYRIINNFQKIMLGRFQMTKALMNQKEQELYAKYHPGKTKAEIGDFYNTLKFHPYQ